jgi:hypothetical protein
MFREKCLETKAPVVNTAGAFLYRYIAREIGSFFRPLHLQVADISTCGDMVTCLYTESIRACTTNSSPRLPRLRILILLMPVSTSTTEQQNNVSHKPVFTGSD